MKITPPARKMPPLIVASTIIPREMVWLWYPYIPSSSATLLYGPGGHGKSHITVDIAARLSTGTALPGQNFSSRPQKVLMLSAEDDFDVVLVPRLMKAGANLDNIAFPKDPFSLDATGLKMLEEYIHQFSATIVFIDPIVRYMGGKVDMNKANEVREFMGGLHELAMAKQTSIIIVGHSRKSRADDASEEWERAMGSADFTNAVRSGLYVTKASDGTRVMKHVKSNYAKLGDTLAFDFGDNGFEWKGVLDEDGIVKVTPNGKLTRTRTSVEKWLKTYLSNGPARSPDVQEAAEAAGFSWRTLNRVKPYVAESYMQRIDGTPVWFWKLLGDEGDDDEGSREISVQGLEEPGERPHVQGAASIRRGAGGRVGGGKRGGARKAVPRVGIARHGSGEEDLPGGGVGEEDTLFAPLSNKERAAQLLAAMGERGLGNE